MKKFMIFMAATVFLVTVVWGISHAGDETLGNNSFSLGIWPLTISGGVNLGGAVNLDVKGDLQMKDASPILFALSHKFNPRSYLDINYFEINNTGTATLTKTFMYNNKNFFAGEIANSSLRMTLLEFLYNGLLSGKESTRLDYLVGLKSIGYNATINDLSTGVSASYTGNNFIPEIGLKGTVKFTDKVNGFLKFLWISGNSGSSSISHQDLYLGLDFLLSSRWNGTFAYKNMFFSAKDSNNQNSLSLNYQGPVLMFQLKF